MCRIGKFNCLHVSMTSPEALKALWQLPIDNPVLHQELSNPTIQVGPTAIIGEEDTPFTDDPSDGSDIPVDSVIEHAFGNQNLDGFDIDNDDGSILRATYAETPDAELLEDSSAVPLEQSRPCRNCKKPVPHGGLSAWEEY